MIRPRALLTALGLALAIPTVGLVPAANAQSQADDAVGWGIPDVASGATVTGQVWPNLGYDMAGYLAVSPSRTAKVDIQLLEGSTWVKKYTFTADTQWRRVWFASQSFGDGPYPDTIVIGYGQGKKVRFQVQGTGQTSPVMTINMPAKPHTPAVSSSKPLSAKNTGKKTSSFWIEGMHGPVTLERKVGSKWVEAAPLPYTNKGTTNRRYIALSIPAAEAGLRAGTTSTYRIRAIGYSQYGVTTWTSTPQSISLPKLTASVDYQEVARLTPRAISTTDGTSVGIYLSTGSTSAYRPVQPGRRAYLQRKQGKKWVNVSTAVNKQGGVIKLPIPKSSKATRSDVYRAYVPATSWSSGVITRSIRMRVDTPTKYTGYRKQMRDAMKKYCPTATITPVGRSTFSGRAYLGYNAIEVINGFRGANLKQVALHECAHLLQWKTWEKQWSNSNPKSLTWTQYQNRMNKIYGTRGTGGIEANADCAANAMGASLKAGPRYTSNCKGARGRAGTATMKGKLP